MTRPTLEDVYLELIEGRQQCPARPNHPGARAPPAAVRLAVAAARGATELQVFLRDSQAVGFIVSLPAILLVLLASIFGGQPAATAAA